LVWSFLEPEQGPKCLEEIAHGGSLTPLTAYEKRLYPTRMANPKYNPDRGPAKKRRLGPNTTSTVKKHPGRSGLYGQPKNSTGFSPQKPQKGSGPCND